MIGAEILTQAMSESGTSVVFSLSGNQIMPIYDACITPGIRLVHVRHENAAVFMADAYAQVSTGSSQAGYGVALVTAGPGFANALGGLYSALMAESPVVLISGDSSVAQDGKRAFQELSQTEAVRPFVKHAERVMDVNRIAEAWRECVAAAISGRPGPVHLTVPFDVLLADGNTPAPLLNTATELGCIKQTSAAHLATLTEALQKAQRPLVLTGPSLSPSRTNGRSNQWQKTTGIPVIAMESPRGLGDPSLGNIGQIVEQADCVVLLGKLPDFTLGFGSTVKMPAETIGVVDACPDSLQQSMAVLAEREAAARDNQGHIIAINDSPQCVADSLCDTLVGAPHYEKWRSHVMQLLAALPDASSTEQVDAVASDVTDNTTDNAESPDNGATQSLLPQQIGGQVQTALNQCEQSVLVCDGGEFGQWAQACVRAERRIINGPSGAIGGSLPQAIAAKISHPDSVVFAMLGDGTAGFHLAELETSVRERAPVIVIIGNDSRWNAEYQIQLRDYGSDRLHSCELGSNVRYDIAAAGLGCAGVLVQTEAELSQALTDAVQRSRHDSQSTCINVVMTGCPAPVFTRV